MPDRKPNNATHGGNRSQKKEQVAAANSSFIVRALEIGPLGIALAALNCLHGIVQLWDLFFVITVLILILNYETNLKAPTLATLIRIISASFLMLTCGWFAFLSFSANPPLFSASSTSNPTDKTPKPMDATQLGKYFEQPEPRQITDRISSADPYQQDAIAKSFVNAPVDWRLYLFSIRRVPFKEAKGLLQISLLSDEIDGPANRQVIVWVPEIGNEKLSLLKKGSPIRVRGVIQSANEMTVALKDGAVLEPIERQ